MAPADRIVTDEPLALVPDADDSSADDPARLLARAEAAEAAGDWDAALGLYETALSRLSKDDGGAAELAADLLRRKGRVHSERGDLEQATELFEASLEVSEKNGLQEQRANALNSLAVVAQFKGDIGRAESLYHRARTLADQIGHNRLVAMADQNLATLANIQGRGESALQSLSSALRRFRQLGDDQAAAWSLTNMAITHLGLEQPEAAERCLDEAFELANRIRDTATLGRVAINRARLHLGRAAFEGARESCDLAFEIFSRLKSKRWLAETHKFYGILYRDTEKPSLAGNHFTQAVSLGRDSGNRLVEAEARAEWALLHLSAEDNREALRCLNRAHRLFSDLHASRELLDVDRRLDDLEATYLRAVRAWGEAIESQDRYTAGHCERVAAYTCELARAVGIDGRDLAWLRMGAFLHDVGKTEVPVEVLNKPSQLTEEEWRLMKHHTVAGDAIVADIDFPWEIQPMVRSHHEHWNGSGYPDGLAGEEIPLHARILCVADVFDALTTTRSYRPALPAAEALRIMEREAGEKLDPELVRIFRGLITGRGGGTGSARSSEESSDASAA